MQLLCVLDPFSQLELEGDTTYALLLEAARRGYDCWTCQVADIGLDHDRPVAEARRTGVVLADTPAEAFTVGDAEWRPIESFDAVLMRTDPPVNAEYLHATLVLERARGKTVLLNDPRALRELNEHLSVLQYPELTPPTVVTRSEARLRRFLAEQGGKVVVKPVDGYGGRGIFILQEGDPNLSSLLETATDHGSQWTMAQRYLPEAVEGDKRILLCEGEPIGAFLRVPPPDEARDNLHVGGKAHATKVTDRDQEIISAIAPMLREYGVLFAGIDVIGGWLTEINLTSPTGIRHVDALEGGNCASPVFDAVERCAAAL